MAEIKSAMNISSFAVVAYQLDRLEGKVTLPAKRTGPAASYSKMPGASPSNPCPSFRSSARSAATSLCFNRNPTRLAPAQKPTP